MMLRTLLFNQLGTYSLALTLKKHASQEGEAEKLWLEAGPRLIRERSTVRASPYAA